MQDKNKEPAAEAKFKEVSEAYEVGADKRLAGWAVLGIC